MTQIEKAQAMLADLPTTSSILDDLDLPMDDSIDTPISPRPQTNKPKAQVKPKSVTPTKSKSVTLPTASHRPRDLQGKYVITTIGVASGKPVYLQDRNISRGGFWTQYLDNALAFDHRKGALKVAANFKYGNPDVIRVEES